LQQAEADENIKKLIIMGDEMWVYDTLSKQSTSRAQQKSESAPGLAKAQQRRLNVRAMLVWFNC